jgi:P4 family phage/plasmid primase-like protien
MNSNINILENTKMNSPTQKNHSFKSPNGNKFVQFEKVDKDKLRYIIDNFYDLSIQNIGGQQGKDNKTDIEGQLTLLKKYFAKVKPNHQVKVSYKQKDYLTGRYFARNALSLQSMSKVIRHTIAKDYYHDIDIVNAHPVILEHYCKKNDLSCTSLSDYIQNRDEFLNDLMNPSSLGVSRDDAKKFLLSIMNGKELKPSEEKLVSNKIKEFYNELITTRLAIIKLEPDLVNICDDKFIKVNRYWNIDGAVTNMLLCDWENRLLFKMINFYSQFSPESLVLVFDGLMIPNTIDPCIKKCEKYLRKHLGITVQLVVKPMDHGLDIDMSSDESTDDEDDEEEEEEVDLILDEMIREVVSGSHSKYASLFRYVYGNDNIRIKSKEDCIFYVWDDSKRLWVLEPMVSIYHIISKTLSPYITKEGNKLIKQLTNASSKAEQVTLNARLKHVQKAITNLQSVNFLKNIGVFYCSYNHDTEFAKIINKAENMLPIKNGMKINLKTKEVSARTKQDLFSFALDVEYTSNLNDYKNAILFFNGLCCGDTELADYFRRYSGYLLTGNIDDRSLHIGWGIGKNGKSSYINILEAIMKNYYTTLSDDALLKQEKKSGATPELVALKSARVAIISETDDGLALNSKRVKGLTGKDTFYCRDLFEKALDSSSLNFQTQSKMFLVTNNLPQFNINDQAMVDRLKVIHFKARFEDNPDYMKDLTSIYLDEFFSYFVDGAFDWYGGDILKPTTCMRDALNEYINDLDVVKSFITDNFTPISEVDYVVLPKDKKSNHRVSKIALYVEFKGLFKESLIKQKEFFKLVERDLFCVKTSSTSCYLARRINQWNDDQDNDTIDSVLPFD